MDEYTLRHARPEDWPRLGATLSTAFHEEWSSEAMAAEERVWEPDRTVVAERAGDEDIAGMASAFTRRLAVPGGVVAASHVTMIGVRATHRRRGLLTRMIGQLHADAAERGEPIAVLWASEGRIYQRFGYGLAARVVSIEAVNDVALRSDGPPADGRVRAVPADSLDLFRPVFDGVWADRPGWTDRDDAWWTKRVTELPEHSEGNLTRPRAAVYEDDGGVQGYLLWQVRRKWDDGGPCGEVIVRELIARTPAAYRELWRFALSVDLTRTVSMWPVSVDEPLPFLIDEPRRLLPRLRDGLWLRILDVPAALTARRYAAPIDLNLAVDDLGTFRLVGDVSSATCEPVGAPADLTVTIGALGAAYLGGVPLTALADGGLVTEHRPGKLREATTAFRWHRGPSVVEMF
jgi:predicted acetyltransferase